MSCGIYKIVCKVTARCYIGQSRNIEGRWPAHLKRFSKVCFDYSILEECAADMLDERERFHIADYNCIEPFGFNIQKGGQGWDMVFTDKHRAKLSVNLKGNTRRKGKKMSDESKRKMSVARTGVKCGPMSDETKRKLSEANKGKKVTPFTAAHRQKISAALTGKPLSAETRRKLSEAAKNRSPESRKASDETKRKLSASAKARYAKARNIHALP